MRRFWLALSLGALAACAPGADDPPADNGEAAAAPAAAPAAPAGCAAHWTVALDRAGFADNGAGKTFPADRLAMFERTVGDAARTAVDEACKAGEIRPESARAIKALTVVTASGADSPIFYEGEGDGQLRLEYVFAESDLTIPSEMELRAGLACWAAPEGETCASFAP